MDILFNILERIVDFVNYPLLNETIIQRELYAVASEYNLNLVDGDYIFIFYYYINNLLKAP